MGNKVDEAITDREREMLTRLGNLTGLLSALGEAMLETGILVEWVKDISYEVKKTDDLVEIWSSM